MGQVRWILLAACTCAACAGGPAGDDPFAGSSLPEWRFIEPPAAVIGGADERQEYALGAVAGAILHAGFIAVADRSAREVRLYDGAGRFVRSMGRRGSGPGEFRSLTSVWRLAGDTLLVWDAELQRATRLTTGGHLTATLTPDLEGAQSVLPPLVGVLQSGALLFSDPRPTLTLRSERPGVRADSVTYLLIDPSGGARRAIWREAGPEIFLSVGDGLWRTDPVIFGRTTLAAAGGEHVFVAYTDSLHVRRLDLYGDAAEFVRPAAARRVDVRWVDAERQTRLREVEQLPATLQSLGVTISDGPTPDEMVRLLERAARQVPARRTLPDIAALKVAADGHLWVGEHPSPDARAVRWLVLDARLVPVGRVTIPAGLELLDASGDAILVRRIDPLGRESLLLHRLARFH